ncbi:hypothetical protein Tsubulata_014270 [Turnera subulata]|uniref:BAT2 N-terminal domain-containing protein n=1 Tax=Turnera subulata TaxID=218843 RepID=A0A9Q0J6R4_9ROSI|nr:hypothetical protein Tsubulata_014270 [Turnera subulata]
MANPGVGAKFVSVNLNKSYGQQQQHHHHHFSHHNNQHQTGSSRARAGGGGMVVLSRPRSSQKAAGPKLSVPPPLNLPSLRKEHERFDTLGSGAGHAGGGAGTGPRPSSSGVGWNKPAAITTQEKEGVAVGGGNDYNIVDGSAAGNNRVLTQGLHVAGNGVIKGDAGGVGGGSVYTPPSARASSPVISGPSGGYSAAEKATVLRGEDFPSLRAALPVNSGLEKKQRDSGNQKQKQLLTEELGNEQRKDGSQFSALVDMRPQMQSRNNVGNGLDQNGAANRGLGGSILSDKDQKQDEYFPGPLPLVRLNPRSDWADDERDTGHGLVDRGRDHGFSNTEPYWERDFDFPRPSVLPHKPAQNSYVKWGQRDNEIGKISSNEVTRRDSYGRDGRVPSREGQEGNSWRTSFPVSKTGFSSQEVVNERNGVVAKPSGLNRESTNENKYMPSPSRDIALEDPARKDLGYGQGGRQPWSNTVDSFGSRGLERNIRERHGSEQFNRYRGDTHQNNSVSKSSFSLGGKSLPVNDPILNFNREKRSFTKSEKPYLEDPFTTGFDGRDPFSGGLAGLVKKKKDVLKQTDFHDPVRESFEAELERVQKMQELERQRIIEEQERAMEQARKEEEERMRLAREQEERERRLEEEAREAAWRAEQERIEAMQRAEEQRIAREEEKRRMHMEEERRKQAAKQKLLELEERMAKRHTDTGKTAANSNASGFMDDKVSGLMTEKDISKTADVGNWEDSERMVESITMSVSSDLSEMNRQFDMGSRPHFSRDGSVSSDRGKPGSPWKRDVFDNGNSSIFPAHDQENTHRNPMRGVSTGGRAYPRKEFYGGPGLLPSRPYPKGVISDAHMDEFNQVKGHRWNVSGDGDYYGRSTETDSEFHENFADRFGDAGWGQSRSRVSPYPPYHERMYPNPDADAHYSFGRSRYSMRQPRVLPPPSITSMHRSSYRGDTDRPGSSNFSGSEVQYNRGVRNESTTQTRYDSRLQENFGLSEPIDARQEKTENVMKKLDRSTTRCDSQSSLSVSSPPDSPVHLSHDDLDESGDSPVLLVDEGKDNGLLADGNESEVLPVEPGKDNMMSRSSIVSAGEDEEWATENDDQLQEQEEYDEDEDGYEDEDEVHDGEDENINLTQEFQDIHLEEKGSSDIDNLVLGFNEGVEVGMPNDEFEKISAPISAGALQVQGAFDGMQPDGGNPVDGPAKEGIDNSSGSYQDTERGIQELVIQSTNASEPAATPELVSLVDASSSSGLSAQTLQSSLGQTAMSTVTSVAVQSEVPVKLQFGLFSGPSLIPSPVPAIQIGSIQMPLHLHPPVGSSLPHLHTSQPLFQFGQLRYPPPISQGVVPLAPQSMSFIQPNVAANFSMNKNVGSPLSLQPGQDASAHIPVETNSLSIPTDNQSSLLPDHLDSSRGLAFKVENSLTTGESTDSSARVQQSQEGGPRTGNSNPTPDSGFLAAEHAVIKNVQTTHTSELGGQHQIGVALSQSVLKEKELGLSKGQSLTSGGRGRRFVYTVKNSGPRSSIQAPEASRVDSSGFQRRPRRSRTEFRVRETAEKRQASELASSSPYGVDDKSNISSRGGARTGSRRNYVDRQAKQAFESEGASSRPASSQEMGGRARDKKGAGKESSRKGENNSHSREDVDAPLQSGVVRVYEQPGIEAPSDDDDFIEVRSKRQMLNDRREQREKEIKAKSRMSKNPRKHRSTLQQSVPSSVTSSKNSMSVGGQASNSSRSNFNATAGRGLPKGEVSAGISAPIVTQPLPPIGTPAVKSDSQADRSQTVKSHQTSSLPAASGGGKNPASGLIFETKDKVLDNVQASLGTWGNSRIGQQVISLTQTQLDEAMKPVQYDSHTSVGDPTNSVGSPSLPSSSALTKEKLLSSTASPINSLLAGEKIQFGAVTSPTVLPPSSRAVPHGIGPPGSGRSEIPISHSLSSAEKDCSLFFEKEKHTNESSAHLEDCEAEAEAAASAVAVAAISSDEIVGNGLGSGSVSTAEPKSFGDASGDQQLASQTKAEESLSVALPADLSVETPPISLWAPLQSPQNSSSQMISHVPGGPPSHFPFYEMNPMVGGPILTTFGPHDESASAQSQSQKSSVSVSGPLGAWPHHSGVDSFYGPPASFTGPFISPPASIPGVQGSHMVFYNHFAPVGQFGQLGLSFMGTYIPSAKQPDWKHNPASSAMGVAEGDMNMVSAQRNSSNMPPPVQHLAPGSPLLPLASPLAMFDVSPFQSSPDMPVQARWSHVPASTLQAVPVSMPLQQQAEGVLPSQFNHGPSVDQPLAADRFSESRMATPSDNSRTFPIATEPAVTQLPDELGLVDPSSNTAGSSTQNAVTKSASTSTITDAGKSDSVQNGSNSRNQSTTFKTQPSHQKNASAQQYGNSTGYSYQRAGAASQKNSSGSEWSHRRMGYQPRNQSSGAEKNFPSSKTKQIYVAKQPSSGTSTAS